MEKPSALSRPLKAFSEVRYARYIMIGTSFFRSSNSPTTTHLPQVQVASRLSKATWDLTQPFRRSRGVPQPRTTTNLFTRLGEIRDIVTANVELSKARQAAAFNKRHIPHPFQVGDLVRINTEHLRIAGQKSRKLRDRFLIGPFRITAVINPVTFRLDLPHSMRKVHNVFHSDRLEKVHQDQALHPEPERPPLYVSDDAEFKVQQFLAVRLNRPRNGLQFLTRWDSPYDDEQWDSWEPFRTMNLTTAMNDFLDSDIWREFTTTPSFSTFQQKYPARVPVPDVQQD